MYSIVLETPACVRQAIKNEKTLMPTELVSVLTMFIDLFGRLPLLENATFCNLTFDSPKSFDRWDLHKALQIAVNTSAAYTGTNWRVRQFQQHLRELVGDSEEPILVWIHGSLFRIDPMGAPV